MVIVTTLVFYSANISAFYRRLRGAVWLSRLNTRKWPCCSNLFICWRFNTNFLQQRFECRVLHGLLLVVEYWYYRDWLIIIIICNSGEIMNTFSEFIHFWRTTVIELGHWCQTKDLLRNNLKLEWIWRIYGYASENWPDPLPPRETVLLAAWLRINWNSCKTIYAEKVDKDGWLDIRSKKIMPLGCSHNNFSFKYAIFVLNVPSSSRSSAVLFRQFCIHCRGSVKPGRCKIKQI